MADLHLLRAHTLGLRVARKIAFKWVEQAEQKFGMDCIYEEGKLLDKVEFTRSGVQGTLLVSKNRFELSAKLGFLFSPFKDRIEAEIIKNLDDLLTRAGPD